jgi:hypothetical protein
VGSGGSQEAAYTLKGPVKAGTYHLVLDSIIIKSVDVTFDLIWRSGSTDMTLATWQQHFDPLPAASYDAQPFEYDEPCPAIDWKTGDELVFRYTGANTDSAEAYIPNGDGTHANGRIPYIVLPK